MRISKALTLSILGTISILSAFLAHKTFSFKKVKEQAYVNEDAYGEKYFPNVELTTHEGKKVKFFDDLIKDKIVLLNFIYTSCGSSCPLETARLKKVSNILGDRIGKDIFFYSISVDPESDSVESLKNYHARFGLKKEWLFLRSEKENVEAILKKFGLFEKELTRKNLSEHNLSVVVGNQRTGQWIKRSHLENHFILAHLLESLNPRREEDTLLRKFEEAPIRLDPISKGEHLFYSRCTDCHSIGAGNGIGPDLLDVVKKRDPKWLNRWLKEPEKMLEEKDPIAVGLFNQFNKIPMPNLKLTDVDRSVLIEFLKKESEERSKVQETKTQNRNK